MSPVINLYICAGVLQSNMDILTWGFTTRKINSIYMRLKYFICEILIELSLTEFIKDFRVFFSILYLRMYVG